MNSDIKHMDEIPKIKVEDPQQIQIQKNKIANKKQTLNLDRSNYASAEEPILY